MGGTDSARKGRTTGKGKFRRDSGAAPLGRVNSTKKRECENTSRSERLCEVGRAKDVKRIADGRLRGGGRGRRADDNNRGLRKEFKMEN